MGSDQPTLAVIENVSIVSADPWAAGVACLQRMPLLPGFTFDRWLQICRDCAGLLENHGTELRELVWTTEDLFGVHPTAPATAVRSYGLGLLLNGGCVSHITADTARIQRTSGAILAFTRSAATGAVPIWTVKD